MKTSRLLVFALMIVLQGHSVLWSQASRPAATPTTPRKPATGSQTGSAGNTSSQGNVPILNDSNAPSGGQCADLVAQIQARFAQMESVLEQQYARLINDAQAQIDQLTAAIAQIDRQLQNGCSPRAASQVGMQACLQERAKLEEQKKQLQQQKALTLQQVQKLQQQRQQAMAQEQAQKEKDLKLTQKQCQNQAGDKARESKR